MNLVSEKYENLLVESVEGKNENQFVYILNELKISPNYKLKYFDGLSIFEKVLRTPKSTTFIKTCLKNGADFFKKNSDGIFPIRFAIESFCPENLETIISEACDTIDSSDAQDFISLLYYGIINEKMENNDNYLHFLISNLNQENFEDLSKMLKLMLSSGCSANSPNHQQHTPFQLLLPKLKIVDVKSDLAKFFVENARIQPTIRHNNNTHDNNNSSNESQIINMEFMMRKIAEWNELEFMKMFEVFKTRSQNLQSDMSVLLEEATSRNLNEIVRFLMKNDVDVNGAGINSKFKMTPAFLACTFGYHQVLKTLLSDSRLNFKDNKTRRTLLHQVFLSDNVSACDRQKCFDLIITDTRCSVEIINAADAEDRVPLFFACFYGKNEMVKELLRRGAYIGHESVTNNIDANILRDFLNECVKSSGGIDEKNCEVYIDYKFLIPPSAENSEMEALCLVAENSHLENFISHPVLLSFLLLKWRRIDVLVYFNLLCYFCFMLLLGFFIVGFYKNYEPDDVHCNNTMQKHEELFFAVDIIYDEPKCYEGGKLVKAKSELDEKIKKSLCSNFCIADDPDFDYYLNHLIQDYKSELKHVHRKKIQAYEEFRKEDLFKIPSRRRFDEHAKTFWFCLVGLSLLLIYEIMQFVSSWRKYFMKPSNWLDIGLISLSFFVLIRNVEVGTDYFKQICAIMILLMAAQSIQLIAKVPAFSLSIHMAILSRVCKTFIKTIAPYLIIIIAFGMSFYALHFDIDVKARGSGDENKEIFSLKRSQSDNFYKLDRYLRESHGDLLKLKQSFESMSEQEKSKKQQLKDIEEGIESILKKGDNLMIISKLNDTSEDFDDSDDSGAVDEYGEITEKNTIDRFEENEKDEDGSADLGAEREEVEDIKRNSDIFQKLEERFKMLKEDLLKKKKTEVENDIDDDDEDNDDSQEKDFNGFSNPFISVISTMRMMLSDFDTVDITEDDYFKGYIFLMFMVFISIVLFNLLNALAISDTQAIMRVAEFVDTKKRISTLKSYERLLFFFQVTILDLFPRMSKIILTPNKSNIVKVERVDQKSKHVKIPITKINKLKKFENIMTEKWMLWNGGSKPVKFSNEFMLKVYALLREREERMALKKAQEKGFKDLQSLKDTLEERLKEIERVITEMKVEKLESEIFKC